MSGSVIEELLARLDQQQARIERLESASGAPPDPSRAPKSRRDVLRTAAVGTAGFVGAMLVEPAIAGAAPAAHTGSFSSTTTAPAVAATNTGKGNAVSARSGLGTTVHASTTSTATTAVALRGTVDGKPSRGTGVVGSTANGTGVRGSSTSGTGVIGTSSTGAGISGTSASKASAAVAVEGTITTTTPGGFSAGVRGVNNGTGGNGIGVYGSQAGSGYGVYGTAVGGYGVVGQSTSGVGVEGSADEGGFGVHGVTLDGNGYGVYGQANNGVGVFGATAGGTAVEGTATTGNAVRGVSSSGYGVFGSSTGNYAVVGVTNSGNGVYGQVSTANQAGVVGRQEDASGNWALYGFGNIGATGTKSAVVPAQDGRGHMTLYCVESPECWFEDFGSARLTGGSATVAIDAEFAQTVDAGEYFVFVQAEGECKGLRVRSKSATEFAVAEVDGGTSSAAFAYRIVARRRDVVAPRLNRVALPGAPTATRHAAAAPPKLPQVQ